MNIPQIKLKSTYGLNKDFSFKSEVFYYVPLTWKLGVCGIEALKIRVASWKPKWDRSNQSIFYFDVKTEAEAIDIINKYKSFNFVKLENRFDKLYELNSVRIKNTGETSKWLSEIIPILRNEFKYE